MSDGDILARVLQLVVSGVGCYSTKILEYSYSGLLGFLLTLSGFHIRCVFSPKTTQRYLNKFILVCYVLVTLIRFIYVLCLELKLCIDTRIRLF